MQVVNEKIFSIIFVYCHAIKRKYNELSAEIMTRNGKCKIMGNFSGYVGNSVDVFAGVHDGYVWGQQN